MEEFSIEEAVETTSKATLGICAGFAIGFLLGASVMAVIDYYDNKKAQLKRIKRDSDENYIYSE
ncbi:MAG: hypothetical protein NC340_06330 [Ruminococcus flavefaciens]|nr:hypothetical protein [Ruminococcus flavefaciens]MCM1230457.1 hypothetical protein [Ruminococcus flavefaciens]